MKPGAWSIAAIAALSLLPSSLYAQDGGFAIGPRISFARGASDANVDAQRFTGGVVRLGGGKTALELAIDYRSGVSGDLTERIKDFPIQASLLVFPVRARLAPYLLGGVGWYMQSVTAVVDEDDPGDIDSETTRRMGWHAGVGAELRLHRRFGLFGDYRYTFLNFGDNDDADANPSSTPGLIPFAEQLRLSHEGSMWTWGATFYF